LAYAIRRKEAKKNPSRGIKRLVSYLGKMFTLLEVLIDIKEPLWTLLLLFLHQ